VDKPKPTRFENIISKVLPGTADLLYNRRISYMASTGAYEPNRSGNRPFSNQIQFLTSPNSRANPRELQELRNYSRFLGYNGIGAAYTNRLTTLTIGSGIGFRASVNAEFLGLGEKETARKNQEFTRFWKLFWSGENGSADRMYSGGYFQGLTFKSMLDGGDCAIIPAATKPRKNHRFPFALKAYEAELISTPYGKESDPSFVDGFQKNDSGVPYWIHIAKSIGKYGMPDAAYFNADNWEKRAIFGPNTGIRQVFHLKNLTQDRPGAIRGIPFLTPATGMIINHNELAEAVLNAAKAQAIFAILFTGGKGGGKMGGAPSDLKTPGKSTSFPRVDMTGGQILDMPEGFDLKAFETTQPRKEFTDHQMHMLSVISAITGIPRSFILMLFDKSYSASKGETSVLWTTVLRFLYTFVNQFLFPFWEYLLSYGVSAGLISAPGFFDDPEIKQAWLGDPVHQFKGPRMPQLDLQKEAGGLKTLVETGLKSRREIIEETTTSDPDQVFSEIEEEEKIFGAMVKTMAANANVDESNQDQTGDDDTNQ
jgi:capsid protein